MLESLARLGLEVADLDRARGFYEGDLGLAPAAVTEDSVGYRVGPTELLLRRPTAVPRGGLHTHYAFRTPGAAVEAWLDRLAGHGPAVQEFGSFRSLYLFDPEGHCVEVAGVDERGDGTAAGPAGRAPPLTGLFEVVLEVADLERAEAWYAALGFEAVDRGGSRRRVRLRGPVDLELWEPQVGLAGARGGVHVELAFRAPDPAAAAGAVPADGEPERVEGGLRLRDPDAHVVTVRPTG